MKKPLVVVLEVTARNDDDDWAFAPKTLVEILGRLFDSSFAKRWDYRFRISSVVTLDGEIVEIGERS